MNNFNNQLPPRQYSLSFHLTQTGAVNHLTMASQNFYNETMTADDFYRRNPRLYNFVKILEEVQYGLVPTMIVVGLICNCLTIFTVSDIRFKQLNSRIMLIALALTDTLVLFAGFFNQSFTMELFGRDVRGDTRIGCKIFFVVYRTGKVFSSWIVVLIAIERFLAVVLPLHVRDILNRRTAITTLTVVLIGVICFNAAWSFSSDTEGNYCMPSFHTPENEELHRIFNIVRGIQYSFLPIIILLTLTPPIIYRLITSHRQRAAIAANALNSTTDLTRTTLMLIMILLLHIVSSIPLTMYFIQEVIYGESIFMTTRTEYVMIYKLQPTLEEINHSSNFLIYVLFSRQFRQRLVEKLRCQFMLYFVHRRLLSRRQRNTESSLSNES